MTTETIPYRPLGHIVDVIESVGLKFSYVYEDLVFVESNAILLKMSETPEEIFFYTLSSCSDSIVQDLEIKLVTQGKERGLFFKYSGKYQVEQKAEKEVGITFL